MALETVKTAQTKTQPLYHQKQSSYHKYKLSKTKKRK